MKKAIRSALICSLALCSLASCSKKDKSDKKAESKTAAIVGRWSMNGTDGTGDDGYGLIFSADGKGSIYNDTSSTIHFTADGPDVGGTVISDKYIKEDGDNLTIDVNGNEMFIMKKLEGREGYDGKYALTGGMFYDRYLEQMKQKGGDNKTPDIVMDFDGDKSEIIINDIFTYEIDDKNLTVSGFAGFLESNGEPIPAEYKIEGDTLSITDSKTTVTLKKVSE